MRISFLISLFLRVCHAQRRPVLPVPFLSIDRQEIICSSRCWSHSFSTAAIRNPHSPVRGGLTGSHHSAPLSLVPNRSTAISLSYSDGRFIDQTHTCRH